MERECRYISGLLRRRGASLGPGWGSHVAVGPRPTFVLDIKLPLLPEASKRGDPSAGADQDAGHLGVSGQVEAGCSVERRESQRAC